jgi:hypothetical protein
MIELTKELRQSLQQSGEKPLWLRDPETNKQYVMLPAELYQRLRTQLEDLDPRDMYPALHRALENEAWSEPEMDDYNRYG